MLFEEHIPFTVPLEDFLNNTKTEFAAATLPIPLGVDKEGKYILGDLEKLGHILIAGTTGSGKSNFINALIYTLIQKYSPEKLQFYLANPKRVEMSQYNGISYLVSEVKWGSEEVIFDLEKTIEDKTKRLQENRKTPKLVIIIDTFSDLIMFDNHKFEKIVQDLTADSLKTGIHLIMCDSRPSTDVFSEKIKNCFPTKIAFNTVNDEDSEVIIGQMGAEWLLGAGDMFLLEQGEKIPVRLQSPWISDLMINKLIAENKKS